MYCGSPFVCLAVKDMEASKRFYVALGMEVVEEVPGRRAIVRSGHFSLTLMPFLQANLLNFRGADVFAIHAFLEGQGLKLEGQPERYRKEQYDADADGESWVTRDPDGNEILFDTNDNERGEDFRQRRLTRVLENTEQELINVGASPECVAAFRAEVLAPFGSRPAGGEQRSDVQESRAAFREKRDADWKLR